jgi:hypothetical protein
MYAAQLPHEVIQQDIQNIQWGISQDVSPANIDLNVIVEQRKARGKWHCFKKLAQVREYVSLCEHQEIAMVRGQQISRPEARLRCGLCDGLEMVRRGWDGSGPVSPRRAGSGTRARVPFQ